MSKILSDQGGKYTVPYKRSEVKEIPSNMSKMKQIDELTEKLVPQVLHKIYRIVDHEMEYSDIDFEPDGSECVRDYQDAHDYIMNQLLNKLLR